MAVGSKIQTTEYNAIQSSVNTLMTKGAYGTTGWGQTLSSGQVLANAKITTTDWNNLRKDILNAYIHQNGTAGTLVSAGATFPPSGGIAVYSSANITGTISSNVLTVTSTSATILIGMSLAGGTLKTGTWISGQLTGTAGSTGTYTITTGATATVQTNLATITYTGTAYYFQVNAGDITSGAIQAGQRITNASIPDTFITADSSINGILGSGAGGSYFINNNVSPGAWVTTKIINDSDRAAFATLANTVTTAGNTVSAATQSATTSNFAVATRTAAWNGTLTHTVAITFAAGTGYSAAQAAAWFFNSGSSIKITASQPVSASPLAKDASWQKLLNTTAIVGPPAVPVGLGTITLGANSTTSTNASGFTVMASSIGFWQLLTTDTILVQRVTDSTTYTPNDYRIAGKVDSTSARTIITLTITFRDLDAPAAPRIDENVNSSVTYPLTSRVELYYASGSAVSVSGYIPSGPGAVAL